MDTVVLHEELPCRKLQDSGSESVEKIAVLLLHNSEAGKLKYEPKCAVMEPVDTQYFHSSLGMRARSYN